MNVLERRLRHIVLIAVAFSALLSVAGFLPGERVYDDSNDCLAGALAWGADVSHHGCTPRYDRIVAVRPAGGILLAVFLPLLIAPALAVWRTPTRGRAWLWAAWSPVAMGLSIAAFVAFDLHLDLFDHVVVLWTEKAVVSLTIILLALIALGVPILLLISRQPADPYRLR